MIKRIELVENILLRLKIQSVLKEKIEEHKTTIVNNLLENYKLHNYIAKIIKEVKSTNPKPYSNTGINVLAELLKNIVPIIEQRYAILQTSEEQQNSFKTNLLSAYNREFDMLAGNRSAKNTVTLGAENDIESELDRELSEESEFDDSFRSEEEPKEDFTDLVPPSSESEESGEKDSFKLADTDQTGADAAFDIYKATKNQIGESYMSLHDSTDLKLFKDYFFKNLEKYFDQFSQSDSSEI